MEKSGWLFARLVLPIGKEPPVFYVCYDMPVLFTFHFLQPVL